MQTVLMPRLSDSMEEGQIINWLRADGDLVEAGQELVEIETDKATVVHESDTEGIVHHAVAAGTTVAVGKPIAWISEDVEDQPPAETSRGSSDDAAPTAERSSPASVGSASTQAKAGRANASPVARRMASEAGLDLSELTGSGPGGRIVKADVEAASSADRVLQDRTESEVTANAGLKGGGSRSETPSSPRAPEANSTGGHGGKGEVHLHQLSRTQLTVSRRMAESRATIPDFQLQLDVDMARSVELRAELKDVCDPPPSLNDFVIRAVALALLRFPRVNSAYRDGQWELYSRVNVGLAVAGPDTLVVPTIFDADQKSIADIARESRGLSGRVRDGSVTPPQLAGGTFTVSNLGMYGIDSFSAVVNPPQSAILAVGVVKLRPVADQAGAVTARPTMILNLSCDHRIIYGADGAQFLAEVRALLERPLSLML